MHFKLINCFNGRYLYQTYHLIRTFLKDVRYSGSSLGGRIPSAFEDLGSKATQSTDYRVLEKIMKMFFPTDEDVVVDVGCGKGRVIGYLLGNGFGKKSRKNGGLQMKGHIYGLEIDEKIASATSKRFEKYSEVSIIAGDALKNIPCNAAYVYLFNPFNGTILDRCLSLLEEQFDSIEGHSPITMIYGFPVHRDVIKNDHPRWKLIYHENTQRRYSNVFPWGVWQLK